MLNILKSIWRFLFHFNPAEDIEWDGRRFKNVDFDEDWGSLDHYIRDKHGEIFKKK